MRVIKTKKNENENESVIRHINDVIKQIRADNSQQQTHKKSNMEKSAKWTDRWHGFIRELSNPDTEMKMLVKYPELLDLFLRYNTFMLFRVSVEWLFSSAKAKDVFRTKTDRLSSDKFWSVPLLCVNKNWFDCHFSTVAHFCNGPMYIGPILDPWLNLDLDLGLLVTADLWPGPRYIFQKKAWTWI